MQYTGITLASLFLTAPPGYDIYPVLWLAGIRSGGVVFYQFLTVVNPDYPPSSVFTSGLLDPSERFPFGFDVAPDSHL